MLKNLNNKMLAAAIAVDIPTVSPVTKTTFDPQTAVKNFIDWALFFVGAIALIFVVYGGILLVTSGGNADQAKKGRDTLLYAILGIVVVVLAYAIVQWAAGTFGPTTIN